MNLLLLLFLFADRPYHKVSIAGISKTLFTHVEVTGKVTLVKKEADGDVHIRLSDGQTFIVAECVPELPCKPPRKGATITVRGVSRFDKEHGWWEVHPVEQIQ
jgi:hypothetical protein